MACSGPAPLTVQFTATPGGGSPPYEYYWTFGDSGDSTEQNPEFTFPSPDTIYICHCYIIDSCGTETDKQIIINTNTPAPSPTCSCTDAVEVAPTLEWTGDFPLCLSGEGRMYWKFSPPVTGTYYLRIRGNSGFGTSNVWAQVVHRDPGSCVGFGAAINCWPANVGAFLSGWTCSDGPLTGGNTYFVEVYYAAGTIGTGGNLTVEFGSGNCPP